MREEGKTGHGSPDGTAADAWAALAGELDEWAAAGMRAGFWLRDDDATRSGPRLNRLLDIAGDIPVALAVIPAAAQANLRDRLDDHTATGGQVAVLQHGYAHFNHTPPPGKSAEYGPHRALDVMQDELADGRGRLEDLFGRHFRPVLVPPWNRISDEMISGLTEIQLHGLSRFGARAAREGPAEVNTHIDIIDWRGSRGFVGDARALHAATAHLAARRTGVADAAEPTGLLCHHRDHDEAAWDFIARFIDVVSVHRGAAWTRGPAE